MIGSKGRLRVLLAQTGPFVPCHGGAPKFNRGLLEGLTALGHECRAVVTTAEVADAASGARLVRALGERGIRPIANSSDEIVYLLNGIEVHAVIGGQRRAVLADQIQRFDPSVVVVTSEDPGHALLEIALRDAPDRVAFLAHTPSQLPFGPESAAENAKGTELILRSAGLITVSQFMQQYIRRWSGREASLIHYAFYGSGPFPKLGAFGEGAVTLVNPCDLKGIDIFVPLARAFPDVPFLAVASWGTRRSDRDALSAVPNVRVLEPVDDIDEVFRRTNILLVPSLWQEAYGIIVVEAMLRGIPVVASDSGGLPEAKLGVDYVIPVRKIERLANPLEGANARSMVPEQDLHPWKRAVGELLTDRSRYEEVSQASHAAAARHLGQIGVRPFEQFLLGVAERKAPPRVAVQVSKESAIDKLSAERRELLARRLKKKQTDVAKPIIPKLGLREAPLSAGQRRLWFADRLEPGDLSYNLLSMLRLRGPLDRAALVGSLDEIVRRHEVLRTTFREQDGTPVQVIAPATGIELQVIDLRGTDEKSREAQIEQIGREELRRPFSLGAGPLFRFLLVELGPQDHVAVFSMHHIIWDGWSTGVLMEELGALYRARMSGAAAPLPVLPIQYSDYAVWQAKCLDEGAWQPQLRYWKERLAGAAPLLELPTDRPRPAVQTLRVARHHFSIGATLTDALKRVGRSEGVTLFMTLLAAFQVLLSKHSGRHDILVGTPVAGRTRSETERLLGFFVNTLVMRLQLTGDPTAIEVLQRVKKMSLEAFENQEVPFDRLVVELATKRSQSYSPLVQVLFIFQNLPPSELDLAGLKLSPLQLQGDAAAMDLTLILAEVGSGLSGYLEYNTDLFDNHTIERMVSQLQRLLGDLSARPSSRLSELQILSTAEKHQLLLEWNDTATRYPEHDLVHTLFAEQAQRTPAAIAVTDGERALTYAELDQRSNQLAWHLRERGVGPDVLVAICVERSVEMVVGLLGILKAGGAYVPLDPSYPRDRLAYMLSDSATRVLLTEAPLLALVGEPGVDVVLLDRDRAKLNAHSNEAPETGTLAAHLAYVIYTSGSTGRPKGVQLTHGSVVNLLACMKRELSMREGERLLAVTSLSFDIAYLELYTPLLSGATVEVASRAVASDGQLLKERLGDESVAVMQATPSTWRMLLDAGWRPRRGQQLLCGGEALSLDLRSALVVGGALRNVYGPTETTIWSSMQRVAQEGPITIGKPIDNTSVYVLAEHLELVPPGVAGELYIGGVGLARGYLNRPALTAEKFVPNPFSKERNARMYRTGDLARWRPDGTLEHLGRIDHQVKVRGFRIELGEVEAALSEQAGVKEAVVVAREGVPGQQRLVAYLTGEVQISGLRAALSTRLPDYMVPSTFVLLAALPLTANGKVDRARLPAPEYRPDEAAYVEPRSVLEAQLVAVWQEVLRVERVGVRDDFFDLGGDSILAVQAVSRARAAGILITPKQLFAQPTIEALAKVSGSVEPAGLERTPRSLVGRHPLSPQQLRIWLVVTRDPQAVVLNSLGLFELPSEWELDVLERCMNEAIQRHAILRTTYHATDGAPYQRIHPTMPCDFRVVDLTSQGGSYDEMNRQLKAESHYVFDLTRGPTVRVTVWVMQSGRRHALITMHHIASDAWSMGILVREVRALYDAFAAGRPSPLPELAWQYVDFAYWQLELLTPDMIERQRSYWRSQIDGYVPVQLVGAARRSPADGEVGAYGVDVDVPEADRIAIQQFLRTQHLTLFMLMMATEVVALWHLSGVADQLVGFPIVRRPDARFDGVVGYFVNHLFVRIGVAEDMTIGDLLASVRSQTLVAYEHQELSLDTVLSKKEMQCLYQHRLNVAPVVSEARTSDEGTRMTRSDAHSTDSRRLEQPKLAGPSLFDLSLDVFASPTQLRIGLRFRPTLFTPETGMYIWQKHIDILKRIVGDPQRTLAALRT